MKQYSIQLAALMVISRISFCSAGEKKCPPEGVELKPVNLNSVEEYGLLYGNWTRLKCYGRGLCRHLSCWEHAVLKGDDRIHFHASWYNERSQKPFSTTAYFTFKEPGILQGSYVNDEFDGTFYMLLVKEDVYIAAGCLKNNEFYVLVSGKKDKFEPHEERLIEETMANNNLNIMLKSTRNENCGDKKAGL